MTLCGEIFNTSAVSSTLRPPKEPQFNHVRLSRGNCGEIVERLIEGQPLSAPLRTVFGYFVEIDRLGMAYMLHPSAPFC